MKNVLLFSSLIYPFYLEELHQLQFCIFSEMFTASDVLSKTDSESQNTK